MKGQVWKYLLEKENKPELAAYISRKDELNKAIAALNTQIDAKSE